MTVACWFPIYDMAQTTETSIAVTFQRTRLVDPNKRRTSLGTQQVDSTKKHPSSGTYQEPSRLTQKEPSKFTPSYS